jgi:hypothetical protein
MFKKKLCMHISLDTLINDLNQVENHCDIHVYNFSRVWMWKKKSIFFWKDTFCNIMLQKNLFVLHVEWKFVNLINLLIMWMQFPRLFRPWVLEEVHFSLSYHILWNIQSKSCFRLNMYRMEFQNFWFCDNFCMHVKRLILKWCIL